MNNKTFLIQFRFPLLPCRSVIASKAEIHGDHLVLLNATGGLRALILLDLVESLYQVA